MNILKKSIVYTSCTFLALFLCGTVSSYAQDPIRDTLKSNPDLLFVEDTTATLNGEEPPVVDLTPKDHSSLIFPLPSASSSDGITPAPTPAPEESSTYKLVMDPEGKQWRMYHVDNLVLGVNVRKYKDFGRWFRIDYYILNESNENKFFDFTNSSVKSSNGRTRLFTHDEFIRKAKRRRFWASFGANVAIMTTGVILDEILNGEYYDGRADHYSLGRDLAHDASSIIISEMSFAGMAAASAYFSGDMSKVYSNNLGYVRDYTIKPGTAIEGHAYARYTDTGSLMVNIPVGGRVYSMNWDSASIGSLKKGEE